MTPSLMSVTNVSPSGSWFVSFVATGSRNMARPAIFASPGQSLSFPSSGWKVGPCRAKRGSRLRSAPLRAPVIEPKRRSPSTNSHSMPEIRGEPSARNVAIVLWRPASNSRRTRSANSGSACSIACHDGTAAQRSRASGRVLHCDPEKTRRDTWFPSRANATVGSETSPREVAMCATQLRSSDPSGALAVGNVAMNLEVVVIPVSDVDRAKAFYLGLGWRLGADVTAEGSRLVHVTPAGSGCSVQFGEHLTEVPPGSAQNLYLVVSDIEAARDELARGGVAASEVFHCASGFRCRFRDAGTDDRVSGRAPDDTSYGSFVSFDDPDGNGWLIQEVTTRLAGRVNPELTSFSSASELAGALRRAAAAHGEHERRIGKADADWPGWYADYMVREQAGAELPT